VCALWNNGKYWGKESLKEQSLLVYFEYILFTEDVDKLGLTAFILSVCFIYAKKTKEDGMKKASRNEEQHNAPPPKKRKWVRWVIEILVGAALLVIGLFLKEGFYCIKDKMSEARVKPNSTRCAVIYLQDDSFSRREGLIIRRILKEAEDRPFKKVKLIFQDSVWYHNNRLHLQHVNTAQPKTATTLYIGYNDESNKELNDWVFTEVRGELFRYDTTYPGGVMKITGERDDTSLALNKPGVEAFFHDVEPGFVMDTALGFQKYAVIVVVPPYSFYLGN
jgi:hypothetical protein